MIGKPRGRRRTITAVCLAAVGLCLAIVWILAAPRAEAFQLPERLGDMEIRGTAWFNVERPITLDDLKGRPVLVIFWATWCPHCRKEVGPLNRLDERFGPRGLVILALTDDSPEAAGEYVERFGVRYAVCAGVSGRVSRYARVVPEAALFSAEGDLIARGHPSIIYPRLERMMRSTSGGSFVRVTKPGASVGDFVRTRSAPRAFGPADLEQTIQGILKSRAATTQAQLEQLYPFYWKNLPTAEGPGDDETRAGANFALLRIFKELGADLPNELLRSLQRELLRRLAARDPGWGLRSGQARHVEYLFGKDKTEALVALQLALGRERNPIVRYRLSQSLAGIDSTRAPLADPQSGLAKAEQRLHERSGALRTKLFGFPSDLAAYAPYIEKLNKTLDTTDLKPQMLRQLAADYNKHRSKTAADLLIRSEILRVLESAPRTHSLSAESRNVLQAVVFGLLARGESDSGLRLRLLYALDAVGRDTLDKDRVLEGFEKLLADEQVPFVRATMDYYRLLITDPARVK